jgi:hypothetical protein
MGGFGGLGELAENLQEALDESPGGVATFEVTRAVSAEQVGSVTKVHSRSGQRCTRGTILHICGWSQTGRDGVAEIRIRDYVCLDDGEGAGEDRDELVPPAFFVATPRSEAPVHLTSMVTSVGGDARMQIKVFAWTITGEPAPKVRFDRHFCVQQVTAIG